MKGQLLGKVPVPVYFCPCDRADKPQEPPTMETLGDPRNDIGFLGKTGIVSTAHGKLEIKCARKGTGDSNPSPPNLSAISIGSEPRTSAQYPYLLSVFKSVFGNLFSTLF
jgi:hypothetical protein